MDRRNQGRPTRPSLLLAPALLLCLPVLAQEPPLETGIEKETAEADTPTEFSEEITVRDRPLRQIEERAREQERESLPLVEVSPSDALGRFPDRDAAW